MTTLARSALGLLLLLPACGDAGLDGPIDGAAALRHVESLVSFNPRHAGSPGARRSAEYLHAQLEAMGIEAEIQEWTDPRFKGDDGEPMVLRNVIGKIPGPEADLPILMFGAHYDTKKTVGHSEPERNFDFEGAIDGGGANGVVLELARAIKARDNKVETWFVFFDGEESVPWVWETSQALIGSRYFVRTLDAATRKRIGAFVLLDLIGDKQLKIDRDLASDKALQEVIAATAKAHDVSDRVYEYTSETVDDHLSFTQFGIRAMLLIDFQYRVHPMHPQHRPNPDGKDYSQWWHSPEDTLDKVSAESLAFTGNLVWHALEGLEAETLKLRR